MIIRGRSNRQFCGTGATRSNPASHNGSGLKDIKESKLDQGIAVVSPLFVSTP